MEARQNGSTRKWPALFSKYKKEQIIRLRGRNLSIWIRGDDVKLLQKELRKLGYTIPNDEADESIFGEETHKTVLEFQEKHQAEATGVVDRPTAELINAEVDKLQPATFVVSGTIRRRDESPFAGIIVRAADKDLRSVQLLGQTKTDKNGHYEISYTPEKFLRPEKRTPDLIVRAYLNESEEQPLVESPIKFDAQPVETIHLMVGGKRYRGPSEYEQLVAELTPLLEGMTFAELKEDEQTQNITFLSGETGVEPQLITFLSLAHRLAQQTKRVPPEAFYGLVRQNLPTDLPALIVQDTAVLRRALQASLHDNIIPARVGKDMGKILRRLRGRRKFRSKDIRLIAICIGAAASVVIAGHLVWPRRGARPELKVIRTEVADYAYVASALSQHFHKPDCRLAGKIKEYNLIYFKSREDAVKSGRKPCKICKP